MNQTLRQHALHVVCCCMFYHLHENLILEEANMIVLVLRKALQL